MVHRGLGLGAVRPYRPRMREIAVRIIGFGIQCAALPVAISWGLIARPFSRKELIWGVDPLINIKYWVRAFTEIGVPAKSLVTHHYAASKASDFDIFFSDLVPDYFKRNSRVQSLISPFFAMAYLLRHASVFHGYFTGGPLGKTRFDFLEPWLFKLAGIKTVMSAYGGDAYLYSKVFDNSLKHVLLSNYPDSGKREKSIERQVNRWNRHADAVVSGAMPDTRRWDCLPVSPVVIDVNEWLPVKQYSNADGISGTVKIAHSPNHRAFKGTEFILEAVHSLQRKGMRVEMDLIEGATNEQVKERLLSADILVEQIVWHGYALSGMEGMATGIAVVSNLTPSPMITALRRFSYLNECPIYAATPETIEDVLEALVKNPERRAIAGQQGRRYVEKYHSMEAARFLYNAVHDKIFQRRDVDLMNLYDPVRTS